MAARTETRFLAAIAQAIRRIGLRPGATIIVALSGGADSVALLRAMLALQSRFDYQLVAAHLNHRMRAEESDRDEDFVRGLCARLGVELLVEHARGLAPGTGNLEERAREVRYAFLNDVAERMGATHIATGHHADDQAETVILRILRGSGAAGLAAMQPAGPGRLIRPMLSVTRDEIIGYLRAIGESYVTDSSNHSSAFLRNRVRNQLIPMLEREYAPGVGRRLVQLGAEMRSLVGFVDETARGEMERAVYRDGALDLTCFSQRHPALQSALLRLWLGRHLGGLRRIGRTHIEAIRRLCLDGPPNGRLDLPGGIFLLRAYQVLRLSRAPVDEPAGYAVKLAVPGTTALPQARFSFEALLVPATGTAVAANPFEALFDAKQTSAGLIATNVARGDRVAPLGTDGQRKVKDIFIDAKLPKTARRTFPTVRLEGQIVWIPGMVRGRAALVTEATQTVLRLRALPYANG